MKTGIKIPPSDIALLGVTIIAWIASCFLVLCCLALIELQTVIENRIGGIAVSTLDSSDIFSTAPAEFKDAKDVSMVFVPAGWFIMGSDNGEDDEKPVRRIQLDAFYIDKYEVTNAQYKACVESGICKPPTKKGYYNINQYFENSSYRSFPVIFVDWNMAKTYCEWRGARLPSEAEWEKAARGTEGLTYPWGEGIDGTYANYGTNYSQSVRGTILVGAYKKGKSIYGTYDMAGNVQEWVADWYSRDYYSIAPVLNPKGPDSGQYRVLKGGAWHSNANLVRSASRYWGNPESSAPHVGFRCARTETP